MKIFAKFFFPLLIILISSQAFANEKLNEKLKIGIVLPLSGPVATMGNAFKTGVEYWQETNPDEANLLEIIYEDHQYDGKETISAVQKLTDINKVDFVIVWGNTPSGVIAPIVEQKKIPTLLVSMNPDALNRNYVVTLSSKVDLLVNHIAKFFKKYNSQKPAAVSIDIGNALLGIKMLKEVLEDNLLEYIIPTDMADFNSVIAKLKKNNVDALYLLTMPEQAITFAKQANAQAMNIPAIGGDIFADPEFQNKYTEFASHVAFAYAAVPDKFIADLNARFKSTAYFGESASGWSALASISRAFALAKQNNSKNIIEFFSKIDLKDFPLEDLEFVKDQEFGAHFKHQVAVYSKINKNFIREDF